MLVRDIMNRDPGTIAPEATLAEVQARHLRTHDPLTALANRAGLLKRPREALDRLRNVVGRVEAPWRPASAEAGFEIVRRRLLQPVADPAPFQDRAVGARAFAGLHRTPHQ